MRDSFAILIRQPPWVEGRLVFRHFTWARLGLRELCHHVTALCTLRPLGHGSCGRRSQPVIAAFNSQKTNCVELHIHVQQQSAMAWNKPEQVCLRLFMFFHMVSDEHGWTLLTLTTSQGLKPCMMWVCGDLNSIQRRNTKLGLDVTLSRTLVKVVFYLHPIGYDESLLNQRRGSINFKCHLRFSFILTHLSLLRERGDCERERHTKREVYSKSCVLSHARGWRRGQIHHSHSLCLERELCVSNSLCLYNRVCTVYH